jgi:hypothetical protein
MLLVGFTLPAVTNAKSMKNVKNLVVTDLDLGMVTNQIFRGTADMDVVLQSVPKLSVSLHAKDISDQGVHGNKAWNLSLTQDGRCVRIVVATGLLWQCTLRQGRKG